MAEKQENNVHIINLSGYTTPQIVEDKRKDWVLYGENNSYYDYLIQCHRDSVTNMSVINNMSRLIYGKGLNALNSSKKVNEYAQMKALFSAPTLRKITKELKQLGQCALQLAYNKNHTKIVRVEYIPIKNIAPEKMNEDGDITAYYYSDDWSDTRKFEPKRISAFGFSKDELEILFIQPFTVGMNYFSDVDYAAALIYAELEGEMAEYQINDIQNGFSPTTIVNFNNGVPTPEQQKLISNKVDSKLTGAKGKKTITSFNANAESSTTVDSLPLNDAPDHYAYLAKEAQQKILNAHNVISSFLVGIAPEGGGFSSSADEIAMASKFFYNTSIVPFQELLLDAIEEVLAFNGTNGLKLYFEPLNLLDTIGEEEAPTVTMSAHLDGLLEGFGEVIDDKEWELLDERDVDYDQEDNFNNQVKEWTAEIRKSLEPKETILSKIRTKLAGTGTARPNANSYQDEEIDGFYFKVRYVYEGSTNGERPFCNAMVNASKSGKVYRKEDIEKMNSLQLNSGHGHEGQAYDIFKYKGGVNCSHVWRRKTYVSASRTIDINSPLATKISNAKADKFGLDVYNDWQVAVEPRNMPDEGHHPSWVAKHRK